MGLQTGVQPCYRNSYHKHHMCNESLVCPDLVMIVKLEAFLFLILFCQISKKIKLHFSILNIFGYFYEIYDFLKILKLFIKVLKKFYIFILGQYFSRFLSAFSHPIKSLLRIKMLQLIRKEFVPTFHWWARKVSRILS